MSALTHYISDRRCIVRWLDSDSPRPPQPEWLTRPDHWAFATTLECLTAAALLDAAEGE